MARINKKIGIIMLSLVFCFAGFLDGFWVSAFLLGGGGVNVSTF
mgnify:CR=1 FL=1